MRGTSSFNRSEAVVEAEESTAEYAKYAAKNVAERYFHDLRNITLHERIGLSRQRFVRSRLWDSDRS